MTKYKNNLKKQNTLQRRRSDQTIVAALLASGLSACGGGGGLENIEKKLSPVLSFNPTGDELVDMMTAGSYFSSSNSSPLFYGLADGHYGEKWENPDKIAILLQNLMNEFNHYSNTNLQYGGYYDSPNSASDAGVSIVLSFDKFIFQSQGDNTLGISGYPHASDNDFGINDFGGDLYINYHWSGWNINSQTEFENLITTNDTAFAFLLQGLSFTLGLKSLTQAYEGRPAFEDTLYADMYEESDRDYELSLGFISHDNDKLDSEVGKTLGAFDILALMHIYGPNQTTNSGDDFYVLSNTYENTIIYDAGGTDTLDFSSSVNIINVALPSKQYTKNYFKTIIDIEIGNILIDDFTATTINLFGEIENINSGSGDDLLIGNELDNVIIGGAGNDQILLSQGSDIIYGGSGEDTFVALGSFLSAVFIGENTIIKDFEVGIDRLLVPNAFEPLTFSQNELGYATFTNSQGVNILLEGIEANVLLIA